MAHPQSNRPQELTIDEIAGGARTINAYRGAIRCGQVSRVECNTNGPKTRRTNVNPIAACRHARTLNDCLRGNTDDRVIALNTKRAIDDICPPIQPHWTPAGDCSIESRRV